MNVYFQRKKDQWIKITLTAECVSCLIRTDRGFRQHDLWKNVRIVTKKRSRLSDIM
jgi:hypothetical protein